MLQLLDPFVWIYVGRIKSINWQAKSLMTFEIFLFEYKLYVYFKINIMIDFCIVLHTLYTLLVQQ